jgi:hypothetical protein
MAKIRDCVVCADQHNVTEMYSQDGGYVCQPCFYDNFKIDEYAELEIP